MDKYEATRQELRTRLIGKYPLPLVKLISIVFEPRTAGEHYSEEALALVKQCKSELKALIVKKPAPSGAQLESFLLDKSDLLKAKFEESSDSLRAAEEIGNAILRCKGMTVRPKEVERDDLTEKLVRIYDSETGKPIGLWR